MGQIISAASGEFLREGSHGPFRPEPPCLVAGTIAASALSLTGFPARSEVQWKKYAGTTIEANLIKGPRGELLQKYASEFTELTGIKVESEVIPEQQQRQKVVIELSSGKPSFDVVHVSYHVQKRQFDKAGWLTDLTPFMKDPNLTTPDLTVDDFSTGGQQFAQNEKARCVRCRGRSIISFCIGTRSCSPKKASTCRKRSTRWLPPPRS